MSQQANPPSNSAGPSNSANNSASASNSVPNIPQTAAVGVLSVTEPPQTATSFYKIAPSVTVTFAWTLSDVIVTPTSITVMAVGQNGNTYPVGPTSVPGTATSITWDLNSYQQANPTLPLQQGNYRLVLWDDRGPTAASKAGYMGQNNQLQFALYTPQAYTPLTSGWTCTGCNSATGLQANTVLIALLTSFLVMFLSGFSILRRTGAH